VAEGNGHAPVVSEVTITGRAAATVESHAERLERDAQKLGHLPATAEALSECVAILRDAAGSLRRGVPSGH
jgi:hypothetical protein